MAFIFSRDFLRISYREIADAVLKIFYTSLNRIFNEVLIQS
jgi:hypothetical protein